jgi:hypothetical protein
VPINRRFCFQAGGTVFAELTCDVRYKAIQRVPCYHRHMFNFGKPKTAGDWIVHVAGAIVAIFLVWWMLRIYVL